MALFRTFTLDGENSADYGLYISGTGVYDAPERAIEMVTIPGRNGALAMDQGYFENIEVTYPAGIFADSQEDFADKMDAIRNWLGTKHSYVALTDDYHPDYFRMAVYKAGLTAKPVRYNTASQFNITFECKPQRFLLSGEELWTRAGTYKTLTDENDVILTDENGNELEAGTSGSNTIVNPTNFDSKPLIIVTGPGTVGIGSFSITVAGIAYGTEVYIDCETMEIYTLSGGVPASAADKVSFNTTAFPVLKPGSNGVSGTAAFQIIPKWWRI